MSDWYPAVVKIEKVEKHPFADTLSIASVMTNYPVVIKTGEYQEGDLVSYINIDSVVPDTAEFYFLCPRAFEQYEDEEGVVKNRAIGPKYPQGEVPTKYRVIKAKKILGIYSQGLLMPAPSGFQEGDSITDHYQLTKMEEEEEDNVKFSGHSEMESPPKDWSIPYYDIESLRKYTSAFDLGEDVVLEEKIHGSCSAFRHDGERLWVKSRNYFKRKSDSDMWWNAATYYDLETKLSQYPQYIFFGEVYGSNKKFRYDTVIEKGQLKNRIAFFDVMDVATRRFLDYDAQVAILDALGLPRAPAIYRGPWQGKEHAFPLAEGQTHLGGKHIREGFVIRPTTERYSNLLKSRLLLKFVGEGYNLSK